MKRLFILAALCGISNFQASADRTVDMFNGTKHHNAPSTYDKVVEKPDHTQLTCQDEGTSSCCWEDGSDPKLHVFGTLVTLAMATEQMQTQIALGVPSGIVHGDVVGTYYMWETDPNGNGSMSFIEE
jgi:hypothetical protein